VPCANPKQTTNTHKVFIANDLIVFTFCWFLFPGFSDLLLLLLERKWKSGKVSQNKSSSRVWTPHDRLARSAAADSIPHTLKMRDSPNIRPSVCKRWVSHVQNSRTCPVVALIISFLRLTRHIQPNPLYRTWLSSSSCLRKFRIESIAQTHSLKARPGSARIWLQ